LLAEERILIAAHKTLLNKDGYTVKLKELLELPVIFIDDAKYTGPMNLAHHPPALRGFRRRAQCGGGVRKRGNGAYHGVLGPRVYADGELYIEADSLPICGIMK
jgi:hypothetical protein